jgi:Ser/Thr protein kinase RdoA (MazF antagonist)
VIELLEPVLGAPVSLDQLKHKPGRRTTFRARGARRNAIVKVYASNRAPTVAARIAALADGPAEVEIPEVLLCEPEQHLVVLSEVPGLPLREALLSDDAETCERAGSALGAWHRAWVGTSPDPLAPHTAKRELEILTARVQGAPEDIAALVQAGLPSVTDGEWTPVTVVHRDLYEEQIMVADRIGLIDLDDSALGPPELDIGNLWGHIDLLELRSGRDLRALIERFLGGYRRTGPALDPTLLVRCRSLTLLRLTCIHADASLLERTGLPQ